MIDDKYLYQDLVVATLRIPKSMLLIPMQRLLSASMQRYLFGCTKNLVCKKCLKMQTYKVSLSRVYKGKVLPISKYAKEGM